MTVVLRALLRRNGLDEVPHQRYGVPEVIDVRDRGRPVDVPARHRHGPARTNEQDLRVTRHCCAGRSIESVLGKPGHEVVHQSPVNYFGHFHVSK